AACAGEPTPAGPPPTPTLPPITPSPLAVDLGAVGAGTFRFTYNDPVSGEFKTATGESIYSGIRNLQSGYLMTLTPSDEALDSFVAFAFEQDIAVGTYVLGSYDFAFSPDSRQVVQTGATLALPIYFEMREGTLTITSIEPLTGAFRFSGIAEVSETETVPVVVDGVFNGIPLLGVNVTPNIPQVTVTPG
ncbi:MAG: hypothetical protein JNJ61_31140, partial [Anaerolineae bacterium]|nr:hypothetical protein [Anaerolineae bacterium]